MPDDGLGPHTSVIEIVLRLGMAIVCGAAIGWDRETQQKPAGFRTNMLVCLGSALFTLTTLELVASADRLGSSVSVDPMRLIGGVIGGIGFLGAGAIIQSRGQVQGMTTAAGIWMVGAIGIACGFGHYLLAGIGTAFGLIVLSAMIYVQSRLPALSSGEDDDE